MANINRTYKLDFDPKVASPDDIETEVSNVVNTWNQHDLGIQGWTNINVTDGSNKRMGTAILVGGTVVVSNTTVTASTRIFLTNNTSGGTVGALYISARVAGTSFTITSTSGTDTSTIAWFLIEPK